MSKCGKAVQSFKILNTRIDDMTQEELLQRLDKGVLVTPNIDHLVLCQTDEEFYRNASQAEFSVCDSRVLQLMVKFVGHDLKEPIPGSSFFSVYCDYHAHDDNIRIFLLGARPGVAQKAQEKINSRVGRRMVVGVYSPPFGFETDKAECQKIVDILRQSTANVVIVGLGNPKQINWIFTYKDQLPNIDVYMALGATIDFEAGVVRRAPQMVQRLRMEWFYRFLREPRRLFHRYFVADMKFFYYFALQLLGRYRDPWGE